MKAKQKLTAIEKIEAEEKKIQIYNLRNGTCEVCGNVMLQSEAQIAHRINKGPINLKKYGKEIIHHRLNLALVCSLECNSAVNISNNPMSTKQLIIDIEG